MHTHAHIQKKEVVLEGEDGTKETLGYDVLIGADGVNSQV
jgi:2-polyprenyl-6-methoxyphenol hydroxylase-like FAD-dependent oxidoreductase